ncbi:BTAD domain-containing putative transcriptional regulator [Longispora sp. NPDC051575]|uniref:BTAD domain-containing putative transcriptional regulator n=1 Tax=Longispora sp. NPDC051575 TaxID=3154943 RepID=UPI00341D2699
MEFRVLGAVEVLVGDIPRDLGLRRMDRCLLGVLLVHLGTPVPVEKLVALLWGDAPPERARQSLHVSVSRLRKALADAPVRLATRSAGYVLDGDPTLVDVHRFQALCEQAHAATDPAARSTLAATAIALYRGPLLGTVATERVREHLAGPCAESLLAVTEVRLAADLDLGRHALIVDELDTLGGTHPLRESLAELRMLALYRAGRRQDALDAYERTRGILADRLGLDPRRELTSLYRRIVRADPTLAVPARRSDVVPAQLPPDVADFTGREEHVRRLDGQLSEVSPSGAVVITALAGAGGVGKTALAVHWAHRVQGRFPDGQLYVNLHGYSSAAPLRPSEVLARFLRALGVAPEKVPLDVEEAAGLYRSLLAGRNVLVVLDNANSPEQVRPLLPGTSGSLALITSRNRLGGLVARDGARRVDVGVLSAAEARALLVPIVGAGRIGLDPDAAADLAELCGYLPLALRIAAAALSDDPQLTTAALCDRLRGDRLGVLEVPGDAQSSVRVMIGLSHASLSPDAARLFCLLGLVPGGSFTADSAAELADADPAEVSRALDRLVAAHLVDALGGGRFEMHDLVREYAREHPPAGSAEAVERFYRWYLHAAHAAAGLVLPHMVRLPLPADLGRAVRGFDSHEEALSWLDAERVTLIAAVLDPPAGLRPEWKWLISDSLRGYLWLRKLLLEWFDVAGAALAAADTAGEPAAQISAHGSLSLAHATSGSYSHAADHARAALLLSREHGLTANEASQLMNLGNILHLDGEAEAAVEAFEGVLRLNPSTTQHVSVLHNMSSSLYHLGRLREAGEAASAGLAMARDAGFTSLVASLLSGVGDIHRKLGEPEAALAVLAEAAALARERGGVETVCVAEERIARVHNECGRHDEALSTVEAALVVVRESRHTRFEARTLSTLATTRSLLGFHDEALELHAEAVVLAGEQINVVRAGCLLDRAETLLRAGLVEAALDGLGDVLAGTRQRGYVMLEAHALNLGAEADSARGRPVQAAAQARTALASHLRMGDRPGEAVSLVVLAGSRATRGTGPPPRTSSPRSAPPRAPWSPSPPSARRSRTSTRRPTAQACPPPARPATPDRRTRIPPAP